VAHRPHRLYRITRAIHPPFDGTGAARYGARWSSPGLPVIYTAGSYAGALLEILVHAQRPKLRTPYHCLVIEVPASVDIAVISPEDVPGWDAADYVASRAVGDAWLAAGTSALLQVPAVTGRPFECNVLINPRHRDVQRLRFDGPYPVAWDDRLLNG
jgi:RES domain-containing protein